MSRIFYIINKQKINLKVRKQVKGEVRKKMRMVEGQMKGRKEG